MADIPCPYCGDGENVVKDSRPFGEGIKRRRLCLCGHRFTTFESVASYNSMASRVKLSNEISKINDSVEALKEIHGEMK